MTLRRNNIKMPREPFFHKLNPFFENSPPSIQKLGCPSLGGEQPNTHRRILDENEGRYCEDLGEVCPHSASLTFWPFTKSRTQQRRSSAAAVRSARHEIESERHHGGGSHRPRCRLVEAIEEPSHVHRCVQMFSPLDGWRRTSAPAPSCEMF